MVEQVQLSERSILGLGNHEECKDKDTRSSREPNERRLSLQVPSGRVERVTSDISDGDSQQVVTCPSESTRLGSKLDGRELGDDGECQRTDGQSVRGVDEHEQCRLNPERSGRFRCRSEDTDEHE